MSLSKNTIQTKPRVKGPAVRIASAIHSAAGLWFFILLSLVLFSGTLAVFAPEMDQLIYPEMRLSLPQKGVSKINPGAIYDAVTQAYPGMGITYIDMAAHDRYAPAKTTIIFPDNKRRTVSIDPYTAKIIGEIPDMTVHSFIARMHAVLFQGLFGFYVVNFCGVLLLAITISGLIIYKRFWKSLFKIPRFKRGTRILLGDLHRLIGLWSIGFLLIISLTGSWYFYNFPLAHLGLVPNIIETQPSPHNISQADLDALGPQTPHRQSGAHLISVVLSAYPDMTITGIMPPMNLNMPFVVYGDRDEYLHGKDSNSISINPFTSEIIGANLSEDLSLSQYAFQGMSQLHHGELLPKNWGWPAQMIMKGIWFLCGLGTCFLSVSGLYFSLKRTRQSIKQLGWRKVWHWGKPWGGPMGLFKYINVLVLVALIAGYMHMVSMGQPKPALPQQAFSSQQAGPFNVSLRIKAGPRNDAINPIQPGGRLMVFPNIEGGLFEDARTILIGLTKAKGSSARGVRVKGAEKIAFAPLRLPRQLEGVEIWIELTQWDGTTSRTQWALSSGKNIAPL